MIWLVLVVVVIISLSVFSSEKLLTYAVAGVLCLLLAVGGFLILDRTDLLSSWPNLTVYWGMLCFLLILGGLGMLLGCCLTAVNKFFVWLV